ncbi:PaaI family thioesterase [Actinomycetospora sp. NBRC 106378]|uniref:PaaI family thioesterase n=1 Tax=Actinomycetospora sp. NBRC 106378 TaxID=3032208 RepID=UPI0024A0207D|nr:PaaI family thioesterase [Actinomycetospora sp. NBRC 106378]GLZ53225.1 phenylacetic acid degradation protein [Actinomycetospora sp. NBRC 106378]
MSTDTTPVVRERAYTWEDPRALAGQIAGRTGLEFLQALVSGELPPPPIMATIGAGVESVEAGWVVFTLTPAEFHYNPIGSVHGGVFATLLDSACGCAVQSTLPAGVGYTSLDLSVRFLRPMSSDTGPVRCEGTVVSAGRRVVLARASITDGTGRLLGEATSSCLLLS